MKTRGASSLIITVILTGMVAVAVGIAAFWGKDIITQSQSKAGVASAQLDCTGVNLEVAPGAGLVTVKNTGKDLAGILLVVHSGGEGSPVLFDQELRQGDVRTYPYMGVPSVGTPEEVDVVGAMGVGIYRPCIGQRQKVEVEA